MIFFSGADTALKTHKFRAAEDGGETDNIKGCYEKTSGYKYPIYKQIGGTFYLKIHGKKKGATWIFADEEKNIKYE